MSFVPLSDNAARQAIDACSIWTEHQCAKAAVKPYVGGMYWKREGGYEYLVKTLAVKQDLLGARSEKTEQIFNAFHARKRSTEERLASLTEALLEAQRQNKALRVGRVPDIVVKVLNTLADAGLERHFRVVGTHALYAYESLAGVRISGGKSSTQDVDLFTDARRRFELVSDLARDAGDVLALLHRVDPSFQQQDDAVKHESYINDKGLEVALLRSEAGAVDPPPVQLCDSDSDFSLASAGWAALLTQSPVFSQIIISVTGRMATMNTLDPHAFVDYARWMSVVENREVIKRRRDALQADVVQEMLQNRMLASSII